MTYSIFQKLAAVTAGTVLMFAVGENLPAQALTITYSFSGSNNQNPFSGTLSFDSSAAADQYVTVAEGLQIAATYGGQSYTQANDSAAAFLTSDTSGGYVAGQGLGLQFYTSAFNLNGENFTVLSDTSGNSDQTVSYTAVPEPSSALMLPAFGLFLLVSKKKATLRSLSRKVSRR